jgi:hypothetical protein
MARLLLVLPELDTLAEQSEVWVKEMQIAGRGEDLQVERYQGMTHGWTQMPDGWLDETQKQMKKDIFDKTVVFTRTLWNQAS